MPELPEVQTTASMLNRLLPGLRITDVWSAYGSAFHKGKPNIKDARYFEHEFKTRVVGAKIERVSRRGKNVLIGLSNGDTIVVHMKMTGHLLYGTYKRNAKSTMQHAKSEEWRAAEEGPLQDPRNRFVRLLLSARRIPRPDWPRPIGAGMNAARG